MNLAAPNPGCHVAFACSSIHEIMRTPPLAEGFLWELDCKYLEQCLVYNRHYINIRYHHYYNYMFIIEDS